jgi:O-antigen biosynthesis protein
MLAHGTKPPRGIRRQRVIERNCTAVLGAYIRVGRVKLALEFSDGLIHLSRTVGRLLRRPFVCLAYHKNGRPRGWLRRLRPGVQRRGSIPSAFWPHLHWQTQRGRPPWADFFDAEWYAERYDDVSASGLTPIQHFIRHGAAEFRDPNPAFDTDWYPRAYPDIAGAGLVPVEHFVLWGAAEDRLPFRGFDLYPGDAGNARASILEAYRHYLAQRPRLGIPRKASGAASDAEIRCLKEPAFEAEAALFVSYSPDGWLKSHVLHYVESLREEGISVILIVNTDSTWSVRNDELLPLVDGLFIRKNKGFDFAAWAHILQLHRELLAARSLYLINDSLIGPISQVKFSDLIRRIRASKADVVGLTETLDRGWHLQSFFLVFKQHALRSNAFVNFIEGIVCYEEKRDVISEYELRLASLLKRAGLDCQPMFRAIDARSSAGYHWRELIDSGFPFVKAELFRNAIPGFDADDCLRLLSSMGFDVRLAQSSLIDLEPEDSQPAEPKIIPPPIKPVPSRRPGNVTAGFAARLAAIPRRPRPEQAPGAANQAKESYVAAKLRVIHSHGGDLPAELHAAMSVRAAGATVNANAEDLVGAAGIVPRYEPPAAQEEHLPTPILRRYREAQIATSRRLRLDHQHVGTRSGRVTISILVPVFDTPLIYLERALLSVICQSYSQWELCVVNNGSQNAEVTPVLSYYEALDQRILVANIPHNIGISAATNIALKMATGSYIGLLDSDDMLAHDALANVADCLANDPAIDLIYTDECKIDENDIVQQLMPKPDWSSLLLTAFMYTGHFSVYRTSIVRELGGLRSRYDFSQDYDLALRVAESNPRVAHVRGYHYGWRMIHGSASVGDKPLARQSNIAALQDAMDRRGWGGEAIALPTANRAFRPVSDDAPSVSIVIPTGGNVPLLARCVSTILQLTLYPNFEVIIVPSYNDAQPEVSACLRTLSADPRIRVVDHRGPYNFSRKCNLGAAASNGEVVIFCNDDVFVISPDWIQAMLECLTLPGIGAVAPKLLYRDNGIQHAGMVTGTRRLLGTAFHTYPRCTTANMNLAQSVREVSLLSAACMAMRKIVFDTLGGFDEINTPREHSDVDLCFRVRELGYSCVYTPHTELTHIGHVTMRAEESENKAYTKGKHDIFLMKRFGQYIADDPYFTEQMRDILYTDSQEAFRFLPRKAPLSDGAPTTGKVRRPLDIMIFSHELTESGAPRAAFDVARTLRNAGHFVVVASPSDGPYRERLRNIGVDVIIDEVLLKQDRNVFDLARNFDKVICNTIACWPAVAQLHKAVDTYWYIHESEGIRNFAENVPEFAAVLRKGIAIWANSRLASRFLSMYDVAHSIVECGIEDHRVGLRPAPRRDGAEVVIGVFGAYERRKGQDLAVSGMQRLSPQLQTRTELRFFGRTLEPRGFRTDLERIAGGNRSIVFFGEVDHDQCLNEIAECDIILIPSRDDALSFVGLDALSLGKALVCSRTTGISDYLQDGRSALILHENTPKEISRALARAIALAELRLELGQRARAVYERTFTLQRFAESVDAALGLTRPAPTTVGGDEPALSSMQSPRERRS